jgi:hypothetical protein
MARQCAVPGCCQPVEHYHYLCVGHELAGMEDVVRSPRRGRPPVGTMPPRDDGLSHRCASRNHRDCIAVCQCACHQQDRGAAA